MKKFASSNFCIQTRLFGDNLGNNCDFILNFEPSFKGVFDSSGGNFVQWSRTAYAIEVKGTGGTVVCNYFAETWVNITLGSSCQMSCDQSPQYYIPRHRVISPFVLYVLSPWERYGFAPPGEISQNRISIKPNS